MFSSVALAPIKLLELRHLVLWGVLLGNHSKYGGFRSRATEVVEVPSRSLNGFYSSFAK